MRRCGCTCCHSCTLFCQSYSPAASIPYHLQATVVDPGLFDPWAASGVKQKSQRSRPNLLEIVGMLDTLQSLRPVGGTARQQVAKVVRGAGMQQPGVGSGSVANRRAQVVAAVEVPAEAQPGMTAAEVTRIASAAAQAAVSLQQPQVAASTSSTEDVVRAECAPKPPNPNPTPNPHPDYP